MREIKQLPEFKAWLKALQDPTTRIRLARRLEKAQRGGLGDVKSVGEGVFEMREVFGPGWRMYYIELGDAILVMLAGGGKGSQQADISRAKLLAQKFKESSK